MADHVRRILRNYRYKTSTTAFGTVLTENALNFFGVGDYIPQAEKMSFYGFIWVTVASGSTGGGGYVLPIGGYRTPGQATVNVFTGGMQHNVFIGGSGLVAVAGGSNFTVTAGGYYSGATNILSITLDLIATGGAGAVG